MIIRQATEADMPAIKELISLFPEKLEQDDLPDPHAFLVAIENSQTVACCAFDIYTRRLAEIRSLAVRPEFQRQGIGQALVRNCMNRAVTAGVRRVLAVSGEKEFFESFGFNTFNEERFALFWVPSKMAT